MPSSVTEWSQTHLVKRRISAELGIQAGAKGPGSLRVEMLDALHSMTEAQIKDKLQVVDQA